MCLLVLYSIVLYSDFAAASNCTNSWCKANLTTATAAGMLIRTISTQHKHHKGVDI